MLMKHGKTTRHALSFGLISLTMANAEELWPLRRRTMLRNYIRIKIPESSNPKQHHLFIRTRPL